MRYALVLALICLVSVFGYAQGSRPELPVRHHPQRFYALVGADVWVDYQTRLQNATLVIKEGRVVSCTSNGTVPDGAVSVDAKGKTIYPSFIDLFAADYGIKPSSPSPRDRSGGPKDFSGKPGPYSWNEALKPEYQIAQEFAYNDKDAEEYRKAGFGMVLSHKADGISRGTGAMLLLREGLLHETMVQPNLGHFLSFRKGSSKQDYPQSLMGCIALLRQTYYDAQWYADGGTRTERNLSLEAWNALNSQPQIFEVGDKLELLRAHKIAQEFGKTYLIKGNGDEYQRINEIKQTGATLIVPVNFPEVPKVNDPYLVKHTNYETLLHWELAPTNLAKLAKAGVPFCITANGLKSKSAFIANLREAIRQGVSEEQVLQALTQTPARLVGLGNEAGTLAVGQRANFIVCTKGIFAEGAKIWTNWVDGKPFEINNLQTNIPEAAQGDYLLTLDGDMLLNMHLDADKSYLLMPDSSRKPITLAWNEPVVSLQFSLDSLKGAWLLEGPLREISLTGNALSPDGEWTKWSAKMLTPKTQKAAEEKAATPSEIVQTAVPIPFKGYGFTELPTTETVLFQSATVWTGEKEGVLDETDVLISNGKITLIGKGLKAPTGAKVIDAKGKHLTAGIIDEHSHVAASRGINEGTQSSSAEVRISDIIDSEDQDMYRQLAGGVTSSHILHGSANAIGGQTQLIKFRWGLAPEQLKVQNWPGFIKFALGENVKQANWGDQNVTRFPQTRMGVEQVFEDYFTRAKEYSVLRKTQKNTRRDLELEALSEILEGKRHITCHSYVQSEINMLMKVAEKHQFKVNTFTHILEGYKLADKMAKHGAGGSTFSDWWAYKFEVYQAIPYNAALMQEQGVTVAINSDDAEMARRLNQEAAKAVKYGGVSEVDAWNMVTINPAKLLHVDQQTGSIKLGKDADVVLWNEHPLSVYATPLATWVDGIRYFDLERDRTMRASLQKDKARLVQKALQLNKKGAGSVKTEGTKKHYHCDTMHDEG